MSRPASCSDHETHLVVFLDGNLDHLADLKSGLPPEADVYVLDPQQDGLAQMAAILAGYFGLDAIHVISHGAAGRLQLGKISLDAATLPGYGETLAAIGQSLADDGDLLWYGCEVAAGDSGQALVRQLARLTGADVAASDDWTGSAALGGDWILEVEQGRVEASPLSNPSYGLVLAGALPTLSIVDATAIEGVDGNAVVTVNLSASSTQTVTVNYRTVDVTTEAGRDYTAASGLLTFNPGETRKTISVPLLDDIAIEGREIFKVQLLDYGLSPAKNFEANFADFEDQFRYNASRYYNWVINHHDDVTSFLNYYVAMRGDPYSLLASLENTLEGGGDGINENTLSVSRYFQGGDTQYFPQGGILYFQSSSGQIFKADLYSSKIQEMTEEEFANEQGQAGSSLAASGAAGLHIEFFGGNYQLVTKSNTTTNALINSAARTATVTLIDGDSPNLAPTGSATAILPTGTEDTLYYLKPSDLLQGFTDADGDPLSVTDLTASTGALTYNPDVCV